MFALSCSLEAMSVYLGLNTPAAERYRDSVQDFVFQRPVAVRDICVMKSAKSYQARHSTIPSRLAAEAIVFMVSFSNQFEKWEHEYRWATR
jgi:hypothetical protein